MTKKEIYFKLETGQRFKKPHHVSSKSDLERFYLYVGQLDNHNDLKELLKLVDKKYIEEENKNPGYSLYSFKFPRCKYIAKAFFYKNELYKIAI